MFESSSGGTELHFIKSVAFAHLPRLIGRGIVRGGKRHAGSIYTTPPESVSTSNMKYIYLMIIFLIFTHDSRPKMPLWPFRCMPDVLVFAQGISTIKAAERDQYSSPLLHRDRIKKHHPLHAVRSIRRP